MSMISPFLSTKFALLATPSKVPAVSKRFKKNEKIIVIMATSNAPKISIFKNIGAILGGRYQAMNSISPIIMPVKVMIRTPRIIAPGTFLTAKTEIIENPRADNNVSI